MTGQYAQWSLPPAPAMQPPHLMPRLPSLPVAPGPASAPALAPAANVWSQPPPPLPTHLPTYERSADPRHYRPPYQ